MRAIFVDAVFWIALVSPDDQWHSEVIAASKSITDQRFVTTLEVLTETLNYYAERGAGNRLAATSLIRSILLDVNIEILTPGEAVFHDGLDLYEARQDKGYSLTDCISMNACRTLGITDVLTNDRHFEQEGFRGLLQR